MVPKTKWFYQTLYLGNLLTFTCRKLAYVKPRIGMNQLCYL